MKVVNAIEMQRLDRETIDRFGIPGSVLMAQAGRAVADYIAANHPDARSAAVLCGTGNNGGDGFVIAYHLHNQGRHVSVFILGNPDSMTPDSRTFHDVCQRMGLSIATIRTEDAAATASIDDFEIIVDAMTGTGFSGVARGPIGAMIERVNAASAVVIAVDIPSGLSSDGDAPLGLAVRATHTVTIGLPKISTVTFPGRSYCGTLTIADIGFPRSLTESDALAADLLDDAYVRKSLRVPNDPDMYKGKAGHLLFIGGFDGMEGAIMMSVAAAFEAGVGLGTLMTTERARAIIAGKIPELITKSLPAFEDVNSGTDITLNDASYDVLLMGPGMGRTLASERAFDAVMRTIASTTIRTVILDGDGLYHLARHIHNDRLPADISWIVTPHFAEAARLSGRSLDELRASRFSSAVSLAARLGAVAVLKGPLTIISDGTRSLINSTGDHRLATGGSGDVLAGIISALAVRHEPLDAAGVGAFLHGASADRYLASSGAQSLKATDIIEQIRSAIAEVLGKPFNYPMKPYDTGNKDFRHLHMR